MDNYARYIIYEAKLPLIFWDYAVEHAIWIKNRVPTEALPWPTPEPEDEGQGTSIPYEAYTGKQLDPATLQKTLVAFGCQANVLELKDQPGKWTPRTKEDHIFVGINGNQVYKLLNCKTLKEILSTDAHFHEYKYPVLTMPQEYNDILKDLPAVNDTVFDSITVEAQEQISLDHPVVQDAETRDIDDGAETSPQIDAETSSIERTAGLKETVGSRTAGLEQTVGPSVTDRSLEQHPPQISRVSGRKIKRTKNPYDSLAKAKRTANYNGNN